MRKHHSMTHRVVIGTVIVSMALSPYGAIAARAQTTAKPTTAKPAAAQPTAKPATAKPAAAAEAPPEEWPHEYTAADGASVLVFEPQISAWENQKKLTLWAAASYTPPGATAALLGTIMGEADTKVSVDERLVDISNLRILQSHFSTATKEQGSAAVAAIKDGMTAGKRVIELDRVLAHLDSSTIRPQNVEGVKADPPQVFFSTQPAVIVNIDGTPVWSPIRDNELRFAVNTNWDLFEHPPTKTFYLRHEKLWMRAASVDGPWTAVTMLPGSFSKLPADDNFKDVTAALPPIAGVSAPRVFVTTAPGELILLRGEPAYEPVPGTRLMWVRNTDSDVFRVGSTGTVYYLVSGRWFSGPGFNGPWTFATPKLPDDFAKIPIEHERSRVLASVPGTPQAAEAVLLASVPQTARVNKKSVQAPDVAYQGDPQFDRIEPTTVARATNTDKDILKVGDQYYMCFQGVWFVSRAATGPWAATGNVPKEIYEIPISSPAHHVTYVTVEDDDDEWVVYATAAAYSGMMVAWGCAVWGTGWYYPPYVWYGGFYPGYYPFYPTYGYSAWYNPWTGAYGRSMGVYGPYGGAGIGARYNPRTGTYARGAVAYGPYGARGAAQAYNPRTGTFASTRQGSNVYGSWGATAVQRGDQWAATGRVTNRATGTTTRATKTTGGGEAVSRRGPQGSGFVGQTGSGDVYAGRDGNVYRKQGDGWQKYDNGGWNSVAEPTPQQREQAAARAADRTTSDRATSTGGRSDPTMGQLDRDSASRREADQRSRDAAAVRSGSSGTRSGSYRPSGGTRGGGGRRR